MTDEKKICSTCGAYNTPDANYCYYCSARLKKRSPVKDFFLAILKGLAFFGFYYAVQSAVSMVYGVIVVLATPSLFSSGFESFDSSYNEIINAIYENLISFMPDIGIISAAITLVCYFLFFKIRKKSFAKEIRLRRIKISSAISSFLLGFSALMIISIGLSVLYTFFPELSSYSNSEELDMLMDGSNPVIQFVNISIVTGIIEEVIFRGLIYRNIRKVASVPVAVIASAVIFGAAHMNIEQFFYTALLGALMALVYEKYGTIIAPIIVHATFNGSNYVLDSLNFQHDMPYLAIMIMALGLFVITLSFVFFTEKIPVNTKNS